MKENHLVELHAIVRGQVQGVGFRAKTHSHAIQLGINGTVKNLSDGSVEIYAQSSKEILDIFLEKISKDNRIGFVESIETRFYKPSSVFDHFSIVYGSSQNRRSESM